MNECRTDSPTFMDVIMQCKHIGKKKREKKRENIRSKVVDELDDRQEKGINVKISLLTTRKRGSSTTILHRCTSTLLR